MIKPQGPKNGNKLMSLVDKTTKSIMGEKLPRKMPVDVVSRKGVGKQLF